MSSKLITEQQDERTDEQRPPASGADFVVRELAPSLLREDEPTLPRALGMVGAALVIFGGMALAFNIYGRAVRVSVGWSLFFLAVGMCGLLFHAAFDRDVQFRRIYMVFGFVAMALGLVLAFIPYPTAAGDQFRWGVPCLLLSLLFLLAFLRNEEDPSFRNLAQLILGGVGAAMAAGGLLAGNIKGAWFLPHGLVFSLIGLIYVAAFVGSRGISDDLAYYAALGLTAAGLLVVLLALGRSLVGSAGASWFVSYGLVFLLVGLTYVAVGAGVALDWPLFVLARRELGAFFYSPMAYLTLLGFSVFSWLSFLGFLNQLIVTDPRMSEPPIEPIVRYYIFALFPVFTIVAVVPVLTMRLLSEEQRSGTMEVLLTAPVDETTIVLSKFLAALLTYLVVWVPFGLFLLAIPLSGGSPFDYRPLLSFLVALVATGAGFIAMGLFFSSLTRNQIASGVLTFAGMLALTYVFFAAREASDPSWRTVLSHVSYLHVWQTALEGKIVLRTLLFPLSMAVLFLFLTVKVVESRKWR